MSKKRVHRSGYTSRRFGRLYALVQIVLGPFRTAISRIIRFLVQLWYLFVLLPLNVVGTLAAKTVKAFVSAWRKGSLQRLLYGLPFALVACVCGYLYVVCHLRSESMLSERYGDAARIALSEQNYAAANLYYERLVTLRGQRLDILYNWAQAADRAKDQARVSALLAILAPSDGPGHAESHLWQAERILASSPTPSREHLQLVHTHLLHAAQLQPERSDIRGMLGKFYMSAGDWSRATEHLSTAVRQKPELSLLLAKAHALQKHAMQAETFAERARSHYESKVAADPKDIESRLGWAEATMFLERFSHSVTILREGLMFSEDRRLRRALARTYIAWADSLPNAPEQRVVKWRLLEDGLKVDPSESMLFDRIMNFLKQNDSATQQARDFLIASIARGQAQMLSHLILGTYEGELGNFNGAIRHLEQAYELDSSMMIAANNLAWFLTQKDPPELNRALTLVETLAKRWPAVPQIRDTHGQILARLQRWSEALVELEAALPQMPNNIQLHTTLAEVYKNLGLQDLALEHGKIVKQLQGNPKSQ